MVLVVEYSSRELKDKLSSIVQLVAVSILNRGTRDKLSSIVQPVAVDHLCNRGAKQELATDKMWVSLKQEIFIDLLDRE